MPVSYYASVAAVVATPISLSGRKVNFFNDTTIAAGDNTDDSDRHGAGPLLQPTGSANPRQQGEYIRQKTVARNVYPLARTVQPAVDTLPHSCHNPVNF